MWARRCSHRSWSSCRGRPSDASSNGYKGDAGVRTLSCAELFRVMAFAQLTWRESAARHRGLSGGQRKPSCSTWGLRRRRSRARRWPMPTSRATGASITRLAQRLIARAKRSTRNDPSVLELDNTVYALDSTTIDLCLSLFDWAPFRSTKAAVKLHTLLDLRGSIPDVHPHQRWQAARRQRAGHPAYRGRRLLRDGSRLRGLRAACTRCIRPAPSSSRAPSAAWMPGACTRRRRSRHRRDLRPARDAQRLLLGQEATPSICGASASRTPSRARRWSS